MQIDLEPKEYRIVGFKRPKRRMSQTAAMRIATLCGIWAASVLWIGRHYLDGSSLIPVAVTTFLPTVAFMLYLVLTDPT